MDAYGVYKEFGEVMKLTKWSKLPDKEVKYEADSKTEVDLKYIEEQKEGLIKNIMAMKALTMAFQDNNDKYCMNMVFNSKTMNWPIGQTWEIMQELKDEFSPTNLMGDAEQQRELEAILLNITLRCACLVLNLRVIRDNNPTGTGSLHLW